MQKQPSEGFFKKMLWEISQNLPKKTSVPESLFDKVKLCRLATSWKASLLFWCFLVKLAIFAKIFFAEHHRTTASDCSTINSSEGTIGGRNRKLWYRNWIICTKAFSGDFEHACDKMQAQIKLALRWCMMCTVKPV